MSTTGSGSSSSNGSGSGSGSTTTAASSTAASTTLKVLYWLTGIGGLVVAFRVLFDSGRQIAAVLVFLLGIVALAFYWARWLAPSPPAKWPPVVTPCPDYLTLATTVDASGNTSHVCYDYVGVSTNGGVLKLQRGDTASASNPAYQFPVRPRAQGETQAAYKTAMCSAAANAGLSWSTLCGDSGS